MITKKAAGYAAFALSNPDSVFAVAGMGFFVSVLPIGIPFSKKRDMV